MRTLDLLKDSAQIGDLQFGLNCSAVDPIERPGMHLDRLVQITIQGLPENVTHQRTLPRPGDTRHADEPPKRDIDGEVAQVVLTGTDHGEPLDVGAIPRAAGFSPRGAPDG